MKSLHKFTSLALLMLFVSMFFVEDAFACSGAYYGWKWANNKNATGLTAKMCSRDFYYNLDASKSIFTWNNISSKLKISQYTFSGDSDNTGDINFHSVELTGTTIGRAHLYKKNVLGGYSEIDISSSSAQVVQARIDLDPSLLDASNSTQKTKTVIHETGHALALMHPLLNNCTARVRTACSRPSAVR